MRQSGVWGVNCGTGQERQTLVGPDWKNKKRKVNLKRTPSSSHRIEDHPEKLIGLARLDWGAPLIGEAAREDTV